MFTKRNTKAAKEAAAPEETQEPAEQVETEQEVSPAPAAEQPAPQQYGNRNSNRE